MNKEKLLFVDRPYEERRSVLRSSYMHDKKSHRAVKTLAYKVRDYLTNPLIPNFDNLETIIKFLIDGFLAYEIIFGSVGEPIGYSELDPITLEPEIFGDEKVWVQFRGDSQERTLPDKSIIYVCYNNMEMSFLQSVYTGIVSAKDQKFINKHYKEIVEKLSTKIR